ncbi:MAG: hypothetical protein KKD38_02515, partial [Candidatus Delongbacteria bacterium]|nr:hypothetical protein [Candidatus Delongbacteria bacterium]MCG2759944.1 hypothetical protein [Candidatus Delongbacteria bacterium]
GNNMLRSLGLSKSFRKSAEILQKGKTEKISYGTVNGDKAFFNCSLGFTSFVLQKRKTNSIAGYFYDTIRLLPSFKGSKIRFLNEEKSIDIFAGFFINTKIYMSRFKFLKVNNSESKLIFFYIKKNNIFKTIATVSLAFFGFNVYDKTEKEKYAVELDDNCELELDGDILKFPDNNRTLIIGNESYIDIIKG